MMNAHDRANLEFLRNLTESGLREWYEQASEDDVVYAAELLASWETELDSEFFGVALLPQCNTLQ